LPPFEQFYLFDMENCRSTDYDLLQPKFKIDTSCSFLEVTNLYRDNPLVNSHSCTEGVNDGRAICISSDDNGNYNIDSDKHLKFSIKVLPEDGEKVSILGLSFFEKSPEYFSWLVGSEGLNNYPNKFAVTIRANDNIIYSANDFNSTRDWKFVDFNFKDNDIFCFSDSTVLEFMLLAYDLEGVLSDVSAWDLDNIQVEYLCEKDSPYNGIEGEITNVFDQPLKNIPVKLSNSNESRIEYSNQVGEYAFNNLNGQNYILEAKSEENVLENVSVLDLLMIQRHILGLQYFSKPYQYLAADVNFDHSINASDLLELRRLILGISENFENNQSWIFLDKSIELKIDNLWDYKLKFPVISNDKTSDLLGVKIGDVASKAITKRSKSTSFFEISDQIVKILISKKNRDNINSIEFKEEVINPEAYQFEEIIPFEIRQIDSQNIIIKDVKFSPNPFNQNLYLNFTTNSHKEVLLTLYNMHGQKISENALLPKNGENNIDLSNSFINSVNSGIYLYSLLQEKQLVHGKIVKY